MALRESPMVLQQPGTARYLGGTGLLTLQALTRDWWILPDARQRLRKIGDRMTRAA